MKELPPFEELTRLAKEDPEELERLRQREVNKLIDQAPERLKKKLQGIQFKVDSQRRIAKNPMDSCIRISNLMKESFENLRVALNEASNLTTPTAPTKKGEVPPKNIIDFKTITD